MSGELRASLADGVLTLVIANEAKRNAMSNEMTRHLAEQLKRADRDEAVKVVLITGAGDRAFCSGHDIDELVGSPTAAFDPDINATFQAPRFIATPTIAAVNGSAYAGGLNLALSCDIRIASFEASFAATGTRLGLLPIAGQLSVLPVLVGAGPALDMLLRARPVDAVRAHELGLVSEVVPPADLAEVALEAARYVASSPPALNAAIKRAVWSTVEAAGRQAREVEEREAESFGRSAEAQRRLGEFLAGSGRQAVAWSRGAPGEEDVRDESTHLVQHSGKEPGMSNGNAPPYSKTRVAGGLVFTAGHIGRDAQGQLAPDVVTQTEVALANLEASLAAHGLPRSAVVRTTVYLADMALWESMNEPYRAFFEEPFPARSAVAVGLPDGVLVEIEGVAVLDGWS